MYKKQFSLGVNEKTRSHPSIVKTITEKRVERGVKRFDRTCAIVVGGKQQQRWFKKLHWRREECGCEQIGEKSAMVQETSSDSSSDSDFWCLTEESRIEECWKAGRRRWRSDCSLDGRCLGGIVGRRKLPFFPSRTYYKENFFWAPCECGPCAYAQVAHPQPRPWCYIAGVKQKY